MSAEKETHSVWDHELDGIPNPKPGRGIGDFLDVMKLSKDLGTAERKMSQKLREWMKSTQFAIIAGAIAPIVCLGLDPILFKGGDEHGGILANHWVFAYGFIGLEIAMLSAWLVSRGRLGPCSGIAAGIFFGGAGFAAILGVLLLPFTVLGVLVLIGLLGFTPFFTAYVYWTQGRLALNAVRARAGWLQAVGEMGVGVVLAFGLPAMAEIQVDREWRAALASLADGDESALSRARFWNWFVDTEAENPPLRRAIESETDPVRKARLERIWWDW